MEKPQEIIEIEKIIGRDIDLFTGDLRWGHIGYKYKTNEKNQVVSLNLSICDQKDIGFLRRLVHLSELRVFDNQINDISALQYLVKITKLGIYGGEISDISALQYLKNLTELSLYKNKITDINIIQHLSNLVEVVFYENPISNINSLRNLTNIKKILLCKNEIKNLPEWILDFNLKIFAEYDKNKDESSYIRIDSNPLEFPPYEIVAQGNDSIKAYFESAKEGCSALNEIKVLLVGDGSAGKTSLSKLLRGDKFNAQESQTHGINIHRWTQDNIKLNLWDFGGQEMMHSTHQFFLSKRSIYILVLDGRKEEDVDYWLKHIRSFGGDSPVLIVLNKYDQNPSFEKNRQQLLEKYPNIHDFYKISCKTGEGLNALQKGFSDALGKVQIVKSVWPTTWFHVKEALENINKDYINSDRYDDICLENKVTDPKTREVIAETLRALGVIVHFPDMDLRDTHVLQPHWITEAVYKIINSKKLAENKGVLCLDCLSSILEKRVDGDSFYPESKYAHIIRLMEKFELCYRLEGKSDFILIPDLLDVQQPEYKMKGELLRFRFEYDFFPKSIMPRFMVKRHQDIQGELRWRTGVVLHDANLQSTAMIRADDHEKLIDIQVEGEQKRDFFAIIRKTFHDIHKTFEKLEVKELIPLKDRPQITVEYEELIGLEKMGETKIMIGKLRKSYSVSELLDGIEEPKKRKKEMNGIHFEINAPVHAPITVGENEITDSFNQQQTQTTMSNETQQLLEALLKEIQALNGKIPDETLETINDDAATLIKESKRKEPRKEQFKLSLEGIMDAVKPISFAVTVLEIAQKLRPLLGV